MRTNGWCGLVLMFQAAALLGADVHLTFTRVIPPPIDLGSIQRLTMIQTGGTDEIQEAFIDRFLEYVDESGTLQINKTAGARLESMDESAFRRMRRQHPADAYVGLTTLACQGTPHSAEGSERDESGARVRRLHQWIDAVCEARLDIRHADGRPFVNFSTHGEGTSPRAIELTADDRAIAFQQAARYAALNAASMITPHDVRDSVDLDDSAPQFDAAWSLIESQRLKDARAILESALPSHSDSAVLHYDLGVLCEAIGDFNAARRYLQDAVRLAPHQRHYREELDMLQRRVAGK